jgi:hypothetical protein
MDKGQAEILRFVVPKSLIDRLRRYVAKSEM